VEDLFRLLLNDASANVRRLAVEAIARNSKPNDGRNLEAILRLLNDAHPAVKRTAIAAMGRLGSAGAADPLVNAWKADDGRDPFLSDAAVRALERLGKPGFEALLASAKSGNAAELQHVIVAFLGFRSRAAAEALPDLLNDPHTTPEQRAALLRSYGNYLLEPALPTAPIAAWLKVDRPKRTSSRSPGWTCSPAWAPPMPGLRNISLRHWTTRKLKSASQPWKPWKPCR